MPYCCCAACRMSSWLHVAWRSPSCSASWLTCLLEWPTWSVRWSPCKLAWLRPRSGRMRGRMRCVQLWGCRDKAVCLCINFVDAGKRLYVCLLLVEAGGRLRTYVCACVRACSHVCLSGPQGEAVEGCKYAWQSCVDAHASLSKNAGACLPCCVAPVPPFDTKTQKNAKACLPVCVGAHASLSKKE